MANSKKRPPKVTPFPDQSPTQNEPEPEETAPPVSQAEPETPFDPPEEPAKVKTKKPPKVLTFFERMAQIPAADWTGDRAKVKVYRLAPLINRLVSSENKFITIYHEPLTEQKLKVDHGSGRYRLYLNYKPPAKEEQNVDTVEIDILDPQYPPNIPPGEWINDDRNRQWLYCKPGNAGAQGAQQQPQQQSGGVDTLMDMFRGVNEIRRELKEEITPAVTAPKADEAAAKVLNPFEVAKSILDMRADNPMVAILTAQQTAAATALEAERQRNHESQEKARDREAKLQEKIIELTTKNATAPAAVPQKGLLEQLMEFSAIPDKLEPIKKLFGWANGNGEAPSRRTTGMDLARDIATKVIDSPIAEGLSALLANLVQPRGMPTQQIDQGATGGPGPQAQPQPDSIFTFIQNVVNPALQKMYLGGISGEGFAEWMDEAYPDRLRELQTFKHPLMPGAAGARVIIAAYKQSPLWPILSSQGEPAFVQFVEEFCAWRPDGEGEPEQEKHEQQTNGAARVIDVEDLQEGRIS